MRVPQTCSMTTHRPGNDVTMQYDKQSCSKARPLIPTINTTTTTTTTTTKTTRSPFAPRIVGSPQPYVSPSLRQAPLPEVETGPKGASREAISTPVKTFLSSNITPRSGSRKARVDSASTTPTATPNDTPNSSRPTSMVDGYPSISKGSLGTGLGIGGVGNGRAIRPRSVITEGNSLDLYGKLSPASEGPNGYGRTTTSPEASPMFFHASDARSSVSSQGPSQRSNLQHKSPSLVH